MNRLLRLLKREARLFFSNKIMVVLYLGGPILYGGMFGLVYTKGKFDNLPIVIVDQDCSPSSRQLTDMLKDSDLLHVNILKHDVYDLRRTFIADSNYAAVIIPYQFEADLLQGRQPEINVYINNTNLMPAGHTNRGLTAVLSTFNAMKTASAGKKTEAFHLNTFRLFNPSSNYFLYIWPSYLGIILQSVAMVVMALSISVEFEKRSFRRSVRAARKSIALFGLTKIVFYFLLSGISLCVYTIYFSLFRQPYPEHSLQVVLIAVPFVLTALLIGMISGLLFRSQLKSLQFLMVLSMPVFIASGYSWPSDQSSAFAIGFANLFPYTPFVSGFRILLTEHGSLPDIWQYILIQIMQLFIYTILAFLLLRKRIVGSTYSLPKSNPYKNLLP
ncbi:ABC transporter permease [Flavobacterium sp.]|uniref:ABC transporter permease n=1 Tax=Flavobacterium sp. TaxID=239 RepID=UPI0039E66183